MYTQSVLVVAVWAHAAESSPIQPHTFLFFKWRFQLSFPSNILPLPFSLQTEEEEAKKKSSYTLVSPLLHILLFVSDFVSISLYYNALFLSVSLSFFLFFTTLYLYAMSINGWVLLVIHGNFLRFRILFFYDYYYYSCFLHLCNKRLSDSAQFAQWMIITIHTENPYTMVFLIWFVKPWTWTLNMKIIIEDVYMIAVYREIYSWTFLRIHNATNGISE